MSDPFADTDSFDQTALDEETELRAMARALEFAEGFKLIFARCNQPDQRRKLITKLRERLPQQNIQEIFLTEPTTHLLDDLRPRLSQPPPDAVFVSGLEYSLPTAAEAKTTPFVANLNASRNSFPQVIPRPLVLWVPEYVLNALILGAPDFFSIRSGVYYFVTAPSDTAEMAESLMAGSMWAVENFSVAEKQERVEALKSLLSDYEALPPVQRDFNIEMRITLRLGHLLLMLGEVISARHYYEKLLHLAKKTEARYYEGAALNALGTIHLAKSEYSEAETAFKHSLAIDIELGDRDAEAHSLLNLGNLYVGLAKYDGAKNAYERSVEIFRELGESALESRALTNLANLLSVLGLHDEAQKTYNQALRIAQVLGNQYMEGMNLLNLSLLYIEQGRLSEAELAQERSRNIFHQVGYLDGLWKTLNVLSHLRELQGDIKRAVEAQKQAIKILERLEDEKNLAWMRKKLAELEAAEKESSQQA